MATQAQNEIQSEIQSAIPPIEISPMPLPTPGEPRPKPAAEATKTLPTSRVSLTCISHPRKIVR